MTFQAKLASHCVLKVIQYGFEISKLFLPELPNHIAKNIKLGHKFVTNLQQGSKLILCNLFWNKYCFKYKPNTAVKYKG